MNTHEAGTPTIASETMIVWLCKTGMMRCPSVMTNPGSPSAKNVAVLHRTNGVSEGAMLMMTTVPIIVLPHLLDRAPIEMTEVHALTVQNMTNTCAVLRDVGKGLLTASPNNHAVPVVTEIVAGGWPDDLLLRHAARIVTDVAQVVPKDVTDSTRDVARVAQNFIGVTSIANTSPLAANDAVG